MYKTDIVRKTDPEIADAIEQELARQRNKIELIAPLPPIWSDR